MHLRELCLFVQNIAATSQVTDYLRKAVFVSFFNYLNFTMTSVLLLQPTDSLRIFMLSIAI